MVYIGLFAKKNQHTKGFGFIANKSFAKGLLTSWKALANHLKRVFFISKPIAEDLY